MAVDMARAAVKEAEQALAVAKRTELLVKAMKAHGRAFVVMPDGSRLDFRFAHIGGPYYGGDALLTGNPQQDEWNLYYACRNNAELSLYKPTSGATP